jgi:hypothetical protein
MRPIALLDEATSTAKRHKTNNPLVADPTLERSMECPKCQLLCPPRTQRCDCGFDFVAGTSHTAPPSKNSNSGLIVGVLIGGAVVSWLTGQFSSSSSAPRRSEIFAPSSSEVSAPNRPETNTSWQYSGIGEGTHLVGQEMPPGRYRTRASAVGCYWARLGGTSGDPSEIHANENNNGPAIVDISEGDNAFTSHRCAPWTRDLSAIRPDPAAPFQQGTFLVGVDVSPGTWRASNPGECYWVRLRDFGGGTHSIRANANGEGVVTIRSSDVGFHSTRCGTWTRIQ